MKRECSALLSLTLGILDDTAERLKEGLFRTIGCNRMHRCHGLFVLRRITQQTVIEARKDSRYVAMPLE